MEEPTTDCAAFDEAVVFLSYFKNLKDPRQQGKVTYPLDEILLLVPARGAGRGRDRRRYRPVRLQETRAFAPLPPV